jgi:hypothetical protein
VKSVLETSEHLIETTDKIKYDLGGKNYNDLVFIVFQKNKLAKDLVPFRGQ